MGAALRVIIDRTGAVSRAQRGQLLCWVPVCLAVGVGAFFGLKVEPNALHYGGIVFGILVLLAIWRALPEEVSPLAMACALMLLGFLMAGSRAHSVAEPVLGWRYYGAVEGRLRAAEIEADVVIKGTHSGVDGIYSADPRTDDSATKYDEVSYMEVMTKDLKVMDTTAIAFCRENDIPIVVFDMSVEGSLRSIVQGGPEGTLVRQ